MLRIAMLYLSTLAILLAMDAFFLTFIAGPQFRATLGDLLLTKPRISPAILFYLMYAAGLLIFVSLPTAPGDWMRLVLFGGLFGLIAYATYDLTNYTTLRPWTLKLVLIDLVWGTFVSASAATAGAWIGGAVTRMLRG
jgi:uncharacterized membrane protein